VVAGPGFDSGAAALPLLALGSTFLGTSLFTGTGYTLAKRTSMVPVLTVVAALINILGLALLVPRWGVVGAALAVCAGYLALTLGSYLYSQRHFPVSVNWLVLGLVATTTTLMAVSASASPGSTATYALAVVAVGVQLAGGLYVLRSVRPAVSAEASHEGAGE
jgi:O-antigen/teichoic acid export membrane protein